VRNHYADELGGRLFSLKTIYRPFCSMLPSADDRGCRVRFIVAEA